MSDSDGDGDSGPVKVDLTAFPGNDDWLKHANPAAAQIDQTAGPDKATRAGRAVASALKKYNKAQARYRRALKDAAARPDAVEAAATLARARDNARLRSEVARGGKGSGHFGHKGRPGQKGGSAPGDQAPAVGGLGTTGAGAAPQAPPTKITPAKASATAGGGTGGAAPFHAPLAAAPGEIGAPYNYDRGNRPVFDVQKWASMDMAARRAEWEKLSVAERDALADARETVLKAQADLLRDAGEAADYTGNATEDIAARREQLKSLMAEPSKAAFDEISSALDDTLRQAGVSDELRFAIGVAAADTLAAQELESNGRQLGDHGMYHIRGDVNSAMEILQAVPGYDAPEEKAAAYLAIVFHDTGYLTPPSQNFLDEGHPRWSAGHYDANVRPMIADALGDDVAADIGHYIRTHDGTDIDWREDPVGSAVRVADNLSVFHDEKLPAVFRLVPGNTAVLRQLGAKEMDLDTARAAMRENVARTNHPPQVKAQLTRAVDEVGAYTPKFTLGMLGGRRDRYEWAPGANGGAGYLRVTLTRNKAYDEAQKMLDLGQAQFKKVAKAYGIDPKKFADELSFTFSGSDGRPLLEAIVRGRQARARLILTTGKGER